MIAELGHYALILSLIVAVAQGTIPLIGAHRNDARMMAMAGPAALAQFLTITVSFAALTYAFVVSDFSVSNVAANSHTDKPMLYKVSGVWGNHEGSMLLWVAILASFGAAVAAFGGNLPPGLKARALAIQALIGVGFLSFVLFTSNPFLRLDPAPLNGNGLNPILQDPGLAFHPPFLYLGYVGFSMAFSFAVAALLEGRVDAAWARWVRPWTLAAWTFLTLGIAMGSWWAYYELGWGGWWFWDPVENASFMPWLVGTALLHSAIVVEKRDALKSWTILLAIITFSLSLLGTFLVRSGVLTSVHSFASDPERGVYVLGLLVIVTGGSLALYAVRAPALKAGGLFASVSREGSLLLNNLLMATAAATVLLGTLWPLFADALNLGKVSVGPPFFIATFNPLMVPLLATMVIGPMMSWKRGDLAGALARLKLAFAAALAAMIFAFVQGGGHIGVVWTAIGLTLSAWLVVGALVEYGERIKLFRASPRESARRAFNLPRSALGMTLAHAGLGLAVAGMTASSAWKVESIQVMVPGETVQVAGYDYTLTRVDEIEGPNYLSMQATFHITKDGDPVTVLLPEKRQFTKPPMPTTEAGIHTTWLADLYAVIGEPDGQGGYVTRIYYNPLVPWMWFGGIIMVLGGFVSLSDRRHRVGAPVRARKSAETLPPQSSPQAG